MALYPNPAQGSVRFSTGSAFTGSATWSLCDLAGRVIKSGSGLQPGYEYEISLSGLKAGAYLLRLQSAQGTQVKKLIVR